MICDLASCTRLSIPLPYSKLEACRVVPVHNILQLALGRAVSGKTVAVRLLRSNLCKIQLGQKSICLSYLQIIVISLNPFKIFMFRICLLEQI